jgi:hypothetical protein
MTDPTQPFSTLRSPAWPSLASRIDGAVSADPGLAHARDALLRPVQLLEAIAVDAPAALGDDALAAERVRTVLCVAAPWKDLDREAAAILKAHPAAAPYQPSILHHGALVIVVLAAVRVTRAASQVRDAVRAVLGLALAASPLEVLGRSDPRPPGAAGLGAMIGSLAARGAAGEPRPEVIHPFAADPVERGRWRRLIALLGGDLVPAARSPRPWDGAYAGPIDEVEPLHTWPGDVRLSGRFKAELPLLEKHALRVVCGSADRPPVAATLVKALAGTIKVNVPSGAAPCWLGFSSPALVDDANAFRERVRALWRERSGADAGPRYREALRDAPVPVEVIPLLGPGLATPPRGAGNRLARLDSLLRDAVPAVAAPVAKAPVAHGMVTANVAPARVVLVRPAVLRDGAPVSVGLDGGRGAVIEAAGTASVEVGGDMIYDLPWLDDPLAVISGDVRAADDARIPGLLDALSRAAARTAGFEDAIWIALVPDERDAPQSPPPKIHAAVGGQAAGGAWQGFARHLPAEAAIAVAVASRRGLVDLFTALFASGRRRPQGRPVASRLRLAGTFDHGGEITLDPPREETRAAGPGAPCKTGVVAVALDAGGNALDSVPVRSLRDFQPSPFVLLLPVAPEVAAVELRIEDQVLARVPRIPGPPVLDVGAEGGNVRWTYSHPISARPSFELEVIDGPVGTLAMTLDPGLRSLDLPLYRFAPDRALAFRLVASDGWNAVAQDVPGRFKGTGPLVARRVRSEQWWADPGDQPVPAPAGVTLVWTLDGAQVGTGPLLTLVPPGGRDVTAPPPPVRALALASVDAKGDVLAEDTRRLEDPYA